MMAECYKAFIIAFITLFCLFYIIWFYKYLPSLFILYHKLCPMHKFNFDKILTWLAMLLKLASKPRYAAFVTILYSLIFILWLGLRCRCGQL